MVSFSSCLDVAAISMDMGEALDTNSELMTVGISNCKTIALRLKHRTSSEIFSRHTFYQSFQGCSEGSLDRTYSPKPFSLIGQAVILDGSEFW